MPNTISWNLQMSVRDGRLNDARDLMSEMAASTREEPGTQGYEWFLSADGKICHINERYADSEAAMVHLGNFFALAPNTAGVDHSLGYHRAAAKMLASG